MQYIKGIDAFREEKRTAVTLGKFDGLHRGHQKLIEKIRSYAGNDCVSVVCAFDMQRSCLMTKEERKKLLAGKVDYLIDYPFTGDLMTMEAERFIQKILYEKLHILLLVRTSPSGIENAGIIRCWSDMHRNMIILLMW